MSDYVAEVNTEAGDYLEDDPAAWLALVEAVRRYGSAFAPLAEYIEDGAAEVLAGTIASYLADQHGVFLRSEGRTGTSRDPMLPPPLIYAATGLAEELSAAGWTVSVRVYPPYGPEDDQPDPILDVWRDADPEVAAR